MAEIPDTQGRRRGLRRHVAGMIALMALFMAVAAWFWNSRQGLQVDAGLVAPHGLIVASAATFIAALVAQIRAMSFGEVLEAAWELLLGLFGLIGAILKSIGNWILGLFGWD